MRSTFLRNPFAFMTLCKPWSFYIERYIKNNMPPNLGGMKLKRYEMVEINEIRYLLVLFFS